MEARRRWPLEWFHFLRIRERSTGGNWGPASNLDRGSSAKCPVRATVLCAGRVFGIDDRVMCYTFGAP